MNALLIALLALGAAAQGPRTLEPIPPDQVAPPLVVPEGTVIPVRLLTEISSEHARPGDGVYAQTLVPIAVDNTIVIPVDTYVLGRVVNTERAGKVAGTAEMTINFHTLQLATGATIPIYTSLGGAGGAVERSGEAGVSGDTSRGQDVTVVGTRAGTGAAIGGVTGRSVRGLGIGAAVGAAVGVTEVLLTRGQDVVLPPGTLLEIVLDAPLER